MDYFYTRVPVATLRAAVAGLPSSLRESVIAANDFDSLVSSIVTNVDRIEHLNQLQDRAFHVAQSLFRWDDRGLKLKNAIAHVQHRWAQARNADAAHLKNYAPRTG